VLENPAQESRNGDLSGDLYHLRDNYLHQHVPDFNFSRADTLASMERIEKILRIRAPAWWSSMTSATSKAMPKFPAYLE